MPPIFGGGGGGGAETGEGKEKGVFVSTLRVQDATHSRDTE